MSLPKCAECDVAVTDSAFKCDSCEQWIHYFCTKLPVYQIIILSKSNRKYTCKVWTIKKHTDYGIDADRLKQILGKQKSDLQTYGLGDNEKSHDGLGAKLQDKQEQPNAIEGNQESDEGSHTDKSLESEKSSRVSQESVTNQKKPQICKFYLQKSRAANPDFSKTGRWRLKNWKSK